MFTSFVPQRGAAVTLDTTGSAAKGTVHEKAVTNINDSKAIWNRYFFECSTGSHKVPEFKSDTVADLPAVLRPYRSPSTTYKEPRNPGVPTR